MQNNSVTNKLAEVAKRIGELRDIYGFSAEEMAEKTELTLEEYLETLFNDCKTNIKNASVYRKKKVTPKK